MSDNEQKPVTVEQMMNGVQEHSTTVDWNKGPKTAKLVEKILRNTEGKK